MAQKTSVNDFAYAINGILAEYKDAINADVEQATRQVSKEAARQVKANITSAGIKGTGAYKNSIRSRMEDKVVNRSKAVVYADDPHYRLTHLLEHGHATVNGGRTKAYPHWSEAEQKAIRDFEKQLREAIE